MNRHEFCSYDATGLAELVTVIGKRSIWLKGSDSIPPMTTNDTFYSDNDSIAMMTLPRARWVSR